MGGTKRKKHHRNSRPFRFSFFPEVRPANVALHRGGKKMGIQPRDDTFDHLFGSSVQSQNSVTARRFLGPSHQSFFADLQSGSRQCSFGPSNFSRDVNLNSCRDNMTSILCRPLDLSGTFENQRPTTNSAKDCLASTTEFPPLENTTRATCGRPLVDIYRVPVLTEEDVPRDIFWLGDPPVDRAKSTNAAEPRIEEMSYEATEGQTPDDSAGAIYWLGDPALEAPRQKNELCRSRLQSNQFNILQTGAAAPSCKIRQARNSIL